jgi:uncharacterized protein (DUF2249 family)
MGLALSSAAALHLDLAERAAACLGRGLDGQELVLNGNEDLEQFGEDASASARIVALRVEALDLSSAGAVARLAARWNVPVSVPGKAIERAALSRLARIFGSHGSHLLVGHETDLGETMTLMSDIDAAGADGAIGLAWEIRPSTTSLDDAGAVLLAARERLGLVRLHGGGPEQHDQNGRGLGALLAQLAVARYTGPTVLCPSSPDQLPRWHAWLESRKATGCGSGHDAREYFLDVRSVEPKDRLETILGAYKALAQGVTLNITLDHDPSCMYYMLEGTEPAGSFEFAIVESGPDVWRAEVRKTARSGRPPRRSEGA